MPKINRFASILILFLLTVFTISAQDDEGERPLRSVPPARSQAGNPRDAFPSYSADLSQRKASNSLITEEALSQPLTQRYIAQYTRPSGITYLNSVMERGSLYMPFIRDEVARRGLPPELIYLPVIESSFISTARSRSGAVGLWQFMMNSISPFDMRVNDTVDERRDIIKSTRGALSKLEENYRAMGSWELALAAYNVGLGAMTRNVRRTGENNYWELVRKNELKQETAHYMPKLVAAAYVLSQPRRFDIDDWNVSYHWTDIPLMRQVSIDLIASESGVDRELLRRLNPELLHGITPADSNYRLKIPVVYAEQINLVLESEDLILIRYHYHVVRQGDTLWSMSRHYGVSVDSIERQNPSISGRYLRLGETIVIPALRDTAPPVRTAQNQRFDGEHIVEQGETLWSLSRRYEIDPQVLAEANNMGLNAILREGRSLRVPIIE